MIMHRTLLNTCAVALVFGATFIAGVTAVADQVIGDDLIVQGSACVGLDCVNNESFGFDTIRMKENNTRLRFNDTSTSPGFPANNWTITANDSTSGGANYLAFDDVTNSKQPFRVTANAPTASLFVDSTGKVGLRTSTPGLDLSIRTGNTPAHRLEQDASGGFTAQTWDIAGNEANFFVRDVTGGSRLPFRIRPGAPTSSVDISAAGNVGIGTASPVKKLHVTGSDQNELLVTNTATPSNISGGGVFAMVTTDPTAADQRLGFLIFGKTDGATDRNVAAISAFSSQAWTSGSAQGTYLTFATTPNNSATRAEKMRIDQAGNVGIGTTVPAAQLHTTGAVRFAGVASCGAGIQSDANGTLSCAVSSRQFKTITGDLAPNVALANIMSLRPQTGSYKETPDVPEHWLIAEDVAAVDPALIGLNDGKPYTVKTQNVVADLIAVVQQQQRRIDELERLLSRK